MIESMLKQLLYQIKKPYHFFKTGILRGLRGQLQFQFPARKLKIITITGTDGKTTSSTLLYHVLKSTGKKVGLISTVGAYLSDEEIETGFHVTTPDPYLVQSLMKKMVDQGTEYLVIEVTSHGAYQHRIWGISPLIAGVTNVTHEHLDYHLNYFNYLMAKLSILKKARIVVLNEDDQSFSKLKKALLLANKKVLTYSKQDKIYPQAVSTIKSKFDQAYNQMNARLVYTITSQLDISNKDFITAIKSFPGVTGRMEEIKNKKGLKVFVDFAHTPNALQSVLFSLKKQLPKGKKLIAVYGCAGLRDRAKRPMMGKIGTDLADLVVLTAEDPRTEDVWSIIRQMKENLETHHDKVISIADRKEAIEFALTKLAKRGDIVAILGKGHEKTICYGNVEYPWSDSEVAKEILTSNVK